jgi:hypothetical protein
MKLQKYAVALPTYVSRRDEQLELKISSRYLSACDTGKTGLQQKLRYLS